MNNQSVLIEALQQENTALRQRIADLEQSEANWRAVFNATAEAVYLLAADETILAVNDLAAQQIARSREALIGCALTAVLPPDIAAQHRPFLDRARASGEPVTFENERAGRWMSNHIHPIVDDVGRVVRLVLYSRDVTDRQQAEATRLENDKRFRVAQDLSLEAFTILRSIRNAQDQIIDFEWTYANPVAGRLLKYPPEELIGRRLLDVLPDNRENAALFERYVRIVESGQGDEVELEYRSESITGWFRNLAVKLDDGIAIAFSDITARKRAEEAVRESEARYRVLVDWSPAAILVVKAGQVVLANPSAIRLLGGTDLDDVLNHSWLDFIAESSVATVRARLQRSAQGLPNTAAEVEVTLADGRQSVIETVTMPITLEGGPAMLVIAQDIAQRKQAEAALRASERRFSSAFEFASIGMALLSTTGAFLKVNQALCNLLGYSAAELTTLTYQAITHPDNLAHDLVHVQQLLTGEINTYQTEKRYLNKQGNWVWGALSISLVRDDQNHPQYIIAQIQDIRQRRQAEEALLKSQNLLTETERLGHVGGWEFNIDTQVQTWTEEVYRIHEVALTHQPTVSEGLKFYVPASRSIIEQAVQSAIEHGEPFDVELEIITATGQQRWVHVIGQADLDHRRIFGFFQDITQRKRAEAAEHEQRQLAEALRDSAEALTSTLNLDEVLDRILTSMERVITFDAADILLLDDERTTARVARHRSLYASSNSAEVMQVCLPLAQALNLQTMLLTGEPVIVPDVSTYSGWVYNPSTSWIQSNLGLPIMIQGQPIGFLSVDSARPHAFMPADIERLRALANQVATAIQNAQLHAAIQHYADDLEQRVSERTRELAEANMRLTELDRLKDEFLSRISHELRTPLAGILISLELLETGKPEKRERYLYRLRQSADRMRDMIEDVLMFSQLNLYTRPDTLNPINLNDLITGHLTAWQQLCAGNGLHLQLALAQDLPHARTDGELIGQAVHRLVVNAINYTPAGTVTIATALRDEADRWWVTISVKDTGPGITPDDLPHIFERFYRGHAAADYKTPGTGIGLTISREIAERLGGRLTVETQVGVGSTFTLWLPAV